ncbi:conserved hypothetical protein, unlikely [Trypanosoma brucei gambiense DAL972]|uniref:Uncharacterized protein n=1 Tax=Trypanosoma brucei gambiense (strain MHOM/CI/86/DAL972) TaxID=679716 RepID=C9ZZ05_TRYB9|nr:conserved hypothetical protein, unlikely [Trypanosoma brucei gambiense DAL972]CBH14654.1 conserved hypothetical protein, unlikely [Trypanosoma brucei gambiense DAL972]|eukprot:XP_011776920.1 conserved hypothetical protein, unlikely [Trypanosoma brucei gambiense DAL972]
MLPRSGTHTHPPAHITFWNTTAAIGGKGRREKRGGNDRQRFIRLFIYLLLLQKGKKGEPEQNKNARDHSRNSAGKEMVQHEINWYQPNALTPPPPPLPLQAFHSKYAPQHQPN